jgi:hypothetical protein
MVLVCTSSISNREKFNHPTSIDEEDLSRRFITPLGTGVASEYRIAFREVTLVPKKAADDASASTSTQETPITLPLGVRKKPVLATRGAGRGRGRGRGRWKGKGNGTAGPEPSTSLGLDTTEQSRDQGQQEATQGADGVA